jgi:hypoxanthine phosphoribosyltransferase
MQNEITKLKLLERDVKEIKEINSIGEDVAKEIANEVKQLIGLNQDLTGRTVIVIEDIVDTGNTVAELKELFRKQKKELNG